MVINKMSNPSQLAGILNILEKETGKTFSADNFYSRLRTQKSIYLLKVLGYRLVNHYQFSLYYYGPYSPSLAVDYYKIKEKNIGPSSVSIPPDQLSIIKKCNYEGVNFLEAVATLHLVIGTRRKEGDMSSMKEEAIEYARELKPKLSRFYDRSWDFLETAGLT